MGKKQHSSGPGSRRPAPRPGSDFKRGDKPFSTFGGDDRRPAPRSDAGSDFPSRPTFGRPGGKPGFGSRPGGDERRFGQGSGDRPYGGGNRPSYGGNDRGFERPQRPFKSFNKPAEPDAADDFMRGRFNKPPRPAAEPGNDQAPRRFAARPDNGGRGFGDERRPYNSSKGGFAGKDNRFGNERRSFDAPRDNEFDERPRQLKGGDDRPVRPARYEDRRDARSDRGDAPARFNPEGRRTPGGAFGRSPGGYDERPRSFDRDERPRRDERAERPAYGRDERSERPSRFGNADRSARPERPTFERRERPDRAERPAKPYGARAERPGRSESMGEAPSYHNLKHYEEDKTRGNKRRRDEPETDGSVRLNRYIANAGICSRREADVLIESGEIRVNGEVVTELGYKVQPSDTVHYGKTNLKREKLVYVLLNKPKDFLTTTDDPEGRKTVMDLVRTASKERIFPVGRLDRNTTGLLLFTNDGEVAQKLSHPSHRNKKIYQVELDKPLTEEHLSQIAAGIELEDGKAEVDDVAVVAGNPRFVGIEIHIGRNRIVRRIFEHLGYDVKTLDRVQYAGLTKKDLARGNWRYLTEKEVIRLKYFM
ncbi:pseudouridine synthase [Hymenobacter sp. B81]|uniref:pseudouridine synthase n=1 Tax=Hymenobacter sp. B81 TaxID=3344878 RepID=UPI0037DCEBBB